MDDLIRLDSSIYKKEASQLTNQEVSVNLESFDKVIKELQKVQKKLKDEAQKRMVEGENIPKYYLIKSKTRKAKDIKKLFGFLREHNIDNEAFLSACSVSVTSLEGEYIKATQNISGRPKKELKEEFNELVKPYLEDTKETLSVRRV